MILLLLGLLLAGLAVAMATRALAFGQLRRRETLANIDLYGFADPSTAPRQRPNLRRVIHRAATGIGTLALNRFGDAHRANIRALLRGAGYYRTTPETFLGYRIIATAGLPLFWLALIVNAGGVSVRAFAAACMMAGAGWVMPKFFVGRRATKRLEQVDREMPELVDLLVTTVEAGVGFAASLQLVARRVEGPLGQELRLALQEQSMGITIEDALQHMLERVDSIFVRAFVQAMLQGQTLGVSIGKILRDLAIDMRKRRRHVAEERAQKAPTKILFPLVLLILPALLVVTLGGPLIGIVRGLGSA